MGRISQSLATPERWRPLACQGLRMLYAPDGSAVQEYVAGLRKLAGMPRPVRPPEQRTISRNFNKPGVADKLERPAAAQLPSAQEVPPDLAIAERAARAWQEEDWASGLKQPWPIYAAKVQAGRALLWTYPEAGLDLAGQASQARSALIRRLIKGLELPVGSNNFWPHRSHPEKCDPEEREYFLCGVKRLSPVFVLAFGPETLADISPDTEYAKYTYINLHGRIHLVLPPLSSLEEETEFLACLDFLATFVSSLQRGGQ